jgi:hypothetical protein
LTNDRWQMWNFVEQDGTRNHDKCDAGPTPDGIGDSDWDCPERKSQEEEGDRVAYNNDY